jgi:hypothetical protein
MESILEKFQISNKSAYGSQKPNIIYNNQNSKPSTNTMGRNTGLVQLLNLLLKKI